MTKVYFTPGPSALYPTVAGHIATALAQQIPSVSHRSQAFMDIYQETDENLRRLLNVPDNFRIYFASSATEIWERLGQNCVEKDSLHLVNGSFSKRFFDIMKQLGRTPQKIEVPFGEGFNMEELAEQVGSGEPVTPELFSITLNESSSGVKFPVADIARIRALFPETLITVDSVSTLPYAKIDFSLVDCVYFSVQKAFGLPAGLGVAILNERCLEKADLLAEKGHSLGSYHSFPSLESKYVKFQTPETPNVMNIYLLGKVAGDFLAKGMGTIRSEMSEKAKLLYDFFQQHPKFNVFVQEEKHRSDTVLVFETDEDPKRLIQKLNEKGFVIGTGYGKYKTQQIRIANFPAHSVDSVKEMIKFI